ncbi:MAG: acyltransferase [Caulobacteraceae bacterium]|nr:MAG: acyltransferase [Caulobacteraceae bacterium]
MNADLSLDRRHDLDWIRVGAFGLLILYHVGMFYVPWDFHVKSPAPVEWLEPVMQLTNPWRLTLLFLVSGAATRFMADRMRPGALAGLRTARLLPPLLFAMAVIVPPQSYYQLVETLPGFADGYLTFWGRYLTASGNWRPDGELLITPTWNHMWFVAYLFVYTLLLALLLWLAPKAFKAAEAGLDRLPAWALVAAPIVLLAILRLVLFPMFEITHALVDDWYNHAVSLSAFLFGFVTARSPAVKARFETARWAALGLWLVSWAVWATYAWMWRGDDVAPPEALRQAMRCVWALNSWTAIAAVLGFAARRLTRGGPLLTWLTLAVFPFYIIHQTVIVVAGHHLARLGLWQPLEAGLLIAVTVAGCLLTNEVARRTPVLRPLFGLKPQPAVARRPPVAA